MITLIEIEIQIEKLKKQAADIKAQEFDRTVREIVAMMQAFGIKTKDLQAGSRGEASKSKVGAPSRQAKGEKGAVPVAAKYRGPNGESWSGRGLTPRWLTSLTSQGQKKEDYAITK